MKKKKLAFLDYMSVIGEQVRWINMAGKEFEGTVISWNEHIASIQLEDGTIQEIPC